MILDMNKLIISAISKHPYLQFCVIDLWLIQFVAWISTIDMEVLDQYKTKLWELPNAYFPVCLDS